MRLIDADALKEKTDHIILILNIGRGHGKTLFNKAIRDYAHLISKDIETAPTVDAVPVIRCRDCKWFGKVGCAIMIADDYDKPTEDDYCSFAERREDEPGTVKKE